MKTIKIFESDFDSAEVDAVRDVVVSGWLTNGAVTKRFENLIGDTLLGGVQSAVAVSSCTAAIHLALIASDVTAGDEVIVPALTFVSDFNVVRAVGATPILCDVASLTNWTPSLQNIQDVVSARTKCCIIVHFAGIPCLDIFKIREFCINNNIVLIEDVAHAAGASISGEYCGTIGDYGAFSFYSNKNISTGEGGCITTKHDVKALERLRSHGMTTSTMDRDKGRAFTYDVSEVGLNYRIDEMRSALGIAQLDKFSIKHKKRRSLVQKYLQLLPDSVTTPFSGALQNETICSVDHIFPILLPLNINRDQLRTSLLDSGIQTTMHYPEPWSFSAYDQQFSENDCPVVSEITKRELTLPLHTRMSLDDVAYICSSLKSYL